MKNLPGRCKSRMMAMKAWGCLPKRNSLLCFFSSFTFLGRMYFLCICLLVFLCCSCSVAFCSVPLLLRLSVCSFLVIFSSGLSLLPSLPRSSFSPGFLCSSVLYAPPVLFPPLSSSSLPACASPVLFQCLWSPAPPVGRFPELKHTQIYVVRQLAYSTELLVCINQA